MSINLGSDLLGDALMAAEPQRAKAAADRLAALAVPADAAEPFEAVLASQPPVGHALVSVVPHAVYQSAAESRPGGTGKPLSPFEQFAAAFLTPLFEIMLPEKAEGVTGSGFAGSVCKSMLAQALANATARADVAGIARQFEAYAKRKT
ncbi:MAG: hypothetical protein ACLPPF_19580 [Rhodomicrobium sp.]